MSPDRLDSEPDSLIHEWQQMIQTANRNNIFCHCRTCSYEWVESSLEPICPSCKSTDVQSVSCWQFPDD